MIVRSFSRLGIKYCYLFILPSARYRDTSLDQSTALFKLSIIPFFVSLLKNTFVFVFSLHSPIYLCLQYLNTDNFIVPRGSKLVNQENSFNKTIFAG